MRTIIRRRSFRVSGVLLSLGLLTASFGSMAFAEGSNDSTEQELVYELQAYYEARLAAFNSDYENAESMITVSV